MVLTTLPVLLALSLTPAANPQTTDAVKAEQLAQVSTITCPLTGENIPSCCCPATNNHGRR